MASAEEEPLRKAEAGVQGKEGADWPVLQPAHPRKGQYFCCPPWMLLLLPVSVLAYFAGGFALHVLCFAVLSLFMFCGLPCCVGYIFTRSWGCRPWSWRTDLYTKLMFLGHQYLLLSRAAPDASPKHMPVSRMRPKGPLEKDRIRFALNIQVPKWGEEEFKDPSSSSVGNCVGTFIEKHLSQLPMMEQFDTFEPDEDPVEYVMRQLSSVYPDVYQVWDDKQSDTALVRFCLYGLGAHRVETEVVGDARYYVIRTNQLSSLPVRDGYARYGGDAYFDMSWRPAMIVDKGLGPLREDGVQPAVTTKPGEPGWALAKFRFRSSVATLVTIVDHLFGLHLQAANLFVTALREQLSAEHPMRRFMTPFTFQTITVNYDARHNLVDARSMAQRCFGFSDAGLHLAFASAPALLMAGMEVSAADGGPIIDREAYAEYLKEKKGIDTEYQRQVVQLWRIYKKFVTDYLAYYYPTHADVVADPEMRAMMHQLAHQLGFISPGDVTHDGGLEQPSAAPCPIEVEYTKFVDVFTDFMFMVTAGHEQVGAVEVYMQDASFCAWKLVPDALVGTKQTATAQALLMSFTAFPMPKLMDETGWAHLFPEPKSAPKPGVKTAAQSFAAFQEELLIMSKQCDAYNEQAASRPFPECFPLYVLNPRLLETSISV